MNLNERNKITFRQQPDLFYKQPTRERARERDGVYDTNLSLLRNMNISIWLPFTKLLLPDTNTHTHTHTPHTPPLVSQCHI